MCNYQERRCLWRHILDKHDIKTGYMTINRYEEKYEPKEEWLAESKKKVCIEYCKNGKPTIWRTLLRQEKYPKYFCYGWIKDNYIGDYVILDVKSLRSLHKAGHLKQIILNKLVEGEYKNGATYSFVPIPISELNSHGVIAYHSDNHPALLDT